ncbi:MAG: hypothetical protein KJ550_10910 [Proteobacteria bacterium]|nr:hypothetical protein [Desulfobacteraceae bacterium]MBU2522147.1 hypothetical protein [Pseudomonadota bacterium]MBU3981423.1 hypothetical protein [Pseudomonadota bacterium]MBU4013962.1 hypothetical protein [Pseudomonadota bacterium]MBU4100164.1 hypothetical protein [Pseudomonadota bacterium]
MVDDHGKVISFSRFKEAVIISASMLFIAIIAAVILFFLYKNTQNDNNKLQDILSTSKKKLSILRNENDILMARLVISESKVNANYANKHESKPEKALNAYTEKSTPDKNDLNAANDKQDVRLSQKQPYEKPAIVSVNNFNVYYEKDKNILRVQYIIKNTDLNTKIAGYTVVILKDNEVNQNEWLILPSDNNLIEGKPSGKAGQVFLISSFREIKLKATQLTNPNRFKKVTVFVFSNKGDLLLEKDFPFLIKSLS